MEYDKDETIIKRREILKYLLTINDKKIKDQIIKDNIEIIKEKYPITEQIRIAFRELNDTIFSNDESKIDDYIEICKNIIPSFSNGLKKDIMAIKNIILNKINSGFVEENNNKFKLIKRIVYRKTENL